VGDPVVAGQSSGLGPPGHRSYSPPADTSRPATSRSARRSSRPGFDALPFSSLYLTGNEWAAEIVNNTVHGVMHVGWVPDGAGCHRGQMAVLVKPNGLLGSLYMSMIKPFRYMIIYPALMREIAHDWRQTMSARSRARE
jgi:Protein of unknown function (DUF2867)